MVQATDALLALEECYAVECTVCFENMFAVSISFHTHVATPSLTFLSQLNPNGTRHLVPMVLKPHVLRQASGCAERNMVPPPLTRLPPGAAPTSTRSGWRRWKCRIQGGPGARCARWN